MRYLWLALSALWLLARAGAHAARKRGARVRRYAAAPEAPRPAVATGPIPVLLPSARTGAAAPPLPPERPRVGDPAPVASVAPLDPYRRRARRDASRRGLVALMAMTRQVEEHQAVRAA
ncbi:hypothetical protein [Nocardiopsis tropica]|uniref:Uncharacterized protein n=1 Tax=Nocardiopsis tropica TaxID=109330 RepID=A0ABU7KLX2_9ACTN|nr:hypothetical protein [Nocardiopsis umidischolae]MEE2050288.1 hypothetical protein [Nocardiopsis umidischolae]